MSEASKTSLTETLQVMQNELECSICQDLFVRAFTLSCSHSFCYNCISDWRANHTNCPVCRQDILGMTPCRALDNMVATLHNRQGTTPKQNLQYSEFQDVVENNENSPIALEREIGNAATYINYYSSSHESDSYNGEDQYEDEWDDVEVEENIEDQYDDYDNQDDYYEEEQEEEQEQVNSENDNEQEGEEEAIENEEDQENNPEYSYSENEGEEQEEIEWPVSDDDDYYYSSRVTVFDSADENFCFFSDDDYNHDDNDYDSDCYC